MIKQLLLSYVLLLQLVAALLLKLSSKLLKADRISSSCSLIAQEFISKLRSGWKMTPISSFTASAPPQLSWVISPNSQNITKTNFIFSDSILFSSCFGLALRSERREFETTRALGIDSNYQPHLHFLYHAHSLSLSLFLRIVFNMVFIGLMPCL